MKQHRYKLVLTFSVLSALVGCNTIEEKPEKAANVFDELEQKVSIAQAAKETRSSWSQVSNANLTLVGPIYQTGFEKKSQATKALAKVLNYIQQNPTQLKQLTQRELTKQFAEIEVKAFELGENEYSYVPAIFNVGYGDEAALNAVFNVALAPTSQAEIGFYIDSQAWQKGIVSLQGYKTIKAKGKDRNSTWYHYKLDLSEQGNKAKVDALLRMSLYAMGSDIREFASIDRDAVMKFNDKDYVVERGNGDTQAFVYQDRLKLIDNEIERKVDALDKERVLNKTANARSVYVDSSETFVTVNTLTDYVSKVSLVSLKNANQSTLLWESKQWDEYAKQAYFLPKLNTQIILSDKFLTLTQGNNVRLKLDAHSIDSFHLVEVRNQAIYLNENNAYMLDLVTAKVTPITALAKVDKLAVNADARVIYSLTENANLSYFDAKTQRLNSIKTINGIDGMQVCESEKLVYWQADQAFMYDPDSNSHHALIPSLASANKYVAANCSQHESKLLLMATNGEIRQFDTNTYQETAYFSGDYDAYDQLNSGFVVQYLTGNEFLYGGKNDLKIRPSTTEVEIRSDYKKRLVRINSARSWLDKSSIKQVVFAEPIPETDLALYQAMFGKKETDRQQNIAYLAFLNEEQADPLLVANKPSLFNALSGGINVLEDGEIMLVKQALVENDNLYTTTIPNWEHLGFEVRSLNLGSQGYDAKVYRQLDNAQLTSDIVSMSLSQDAKWLVTTLTNGEVRFESLQAGFDFNETFEAHSNQVTAATLSVDSQLMATAGKDGLIKIWRITIPQENDGTWFALEKELKGYAGTVLDLTFINDDVLISTGSDQTIKLWDIKTTGNIKNEMLGHTDTIRFADFDNSLNQIISASDDGSIRVWDVENAEQVKSFKGSDGALASYDVNANIIAYSSKKTVLVKNIVSGNTLGRIPFEQQPLAIELGFNGSVIYLVYPEMISVFKVSSAKHINDIALTDVKGIQQVFSSHDSHDLYLVTDQEASLINMGRYALFGIDNAYK